MTTYAIQDACGGHSIFTDPDAASNYAKLDVAVLETASSLLDLMREAQEAGMPLMKWAMIDSAWVRRPFVPKVVGGNRADEPMEKRDGR